MTIRSTSKAIIVHNGKVLLNRCRDSKNGEYYALPGGGQNKYETLSEALIRECLEETGYTVTSIRFAALCEEICDDPEFREKYPDYAHKVYHIFLCNLSGETVVIPIEKDVMQVDSEWIAIEKLKDIRLLPKALEKNILEIIHGTFPVFLGSEHVKFNHG